MVYLHWLDCPEKSGPHAVREGGSNRTEKQT